MGSSVPETGASRGRAVSTPAALIDGTEPAEDTEPSTRDIRLFWCANAADSLGSQASGVVLPLLLLGLGYSCGGGGAGRGGVDGDRADARPARRRTRRPWRA